MTHSVEEEISSDGLSTDSRDISLNEDAGDTFSSSRGRDRTPGGSHPDQGVRYFLKILFRTKGAPQIIALALALSLSIGPLVSAVPDVVEDRYARLLHGYDGPHCSSFERAHKPAECLTGGDNAQNAAAKSAFIQNVVILLSNSIIGSMSDCLGRKGFLACSLLLASLAPLSLFLLQVVESMNPVWYYAADASSGLISSLAMSFTMLSDIMAPIHRAPSFGVLLSAYMLGFALSQLFAYFMTHIAVSALAVTLLAVSLLFSLIAVPETLTDEARKRAILRRQAESRKFSYCGFFLRPIREMSILNRNGLFRTLSTVTFCTGLVYTSDKTLIVYYVEDVLGYSYQDVASMFFVMALLGIFVQIFLLNAAIGWLGEKGLLIATCMCGSTHNALYGLAGFAFPRKGIFGALCLSEITALTFPIQISMRSNLVDEAEQGRVQGAFQSLTAVADAVGPVMLQFIFHRTEHESKFGPGTMFLFAALVYLLGGSIACSLPAGQVNLTRRDCDDVSVDGPGNMQQPLLSSSSSSIGSDAGDESL
mmetsp:Transcript_51796/g.155438  ORF Transcript_51796/g.155438 Transcript_51796/m.155438 type:complete len:536 (-) Transcript_51796:197-1804(-)